jgi:CRP-like cAMP-binding protein
MQTFSPIHGSRIPAAIALRGAANMPQHTPGTVNGTRRAFDRGEEIFAEGEPCSVFFKVVSGTVRTGKLLADGRRQIDTFHFPGDVFGLESGEEPSVHGRGGRQRWWWWPIPLELRRRRPGTIRRSASSS